MPNDNVLTDERREQLELIERCQPDLLLVHIRDNTAFDVALLERVFELAKERARALLATPQMEPRAEVTHTAIDADMVWRDEDGESFYHSIDDAVEAEIEQSHPDTEPFEMKLTLAKRMPSATVRVFNITESGYEWEIVDAARTGASS